MCVSEINGIACCHSKAIYILYIYLYVYIYIAVVVRVFFSRRIQIACFMTYFEHYIFCYSIKIIDDITIITKKESFETYDGQIVQIQNLLHRSHAAASSHSLQCS